MKLSVRRISLELDYGEICHWWKEQDRAILSWSLLPVLGFLCEDETEKLAVSWLYCSDSVTGFVAWTTVNPASNKRKVSQALKLVEKAIEAGGRQSGMKMLFGFSGGGGFSRLLIKSGWKNTLIKHDFLMKEI
jgi:hypothetical protein